METSSLSAGRAVATSRKNEPPAVTMGLPLTKTAGPSSGSGRSMKRSRPSASPAATADTRVLTTVAVSTVMVNSSVAVLSSSSIAR